MKHTMIYMEKTLDLGFRMVMNLSTEVAFLGQFFVTETPWDIKITDPTSFPLSLPVPINSKLFIFKKALFYHFIRWYHRKQFR